MSMNGATPVHLTKPGVASVNPILMRIVGCLRNHADCDAIDPAEFAPELLPHLFILAIESNEPPRLRIRLTGTALDAALGRPLKGHYLEEFLHGTHSTSVLAGFHACAKTGEAVWMRQVVEITGRLPRYVEGVALRIEPGRIYGGMLFGEVAQRSTQASFERRQI